MLVWYKLLVLVAWFTLHGVKSIQIRLVNGNKDNSYTSNYANNEPDSYSYNYDISDQGTGDQKAKWEKRENNVVRGAYSIVEPDGSTRLVEYTADQNGFRPVVTKLNTPSISPPNSPSFYNTGAPHEARNPSYSSYANQNQRTSQIYGDRTGYVNPNTPFLSTVYNNDYYQRGRVAGYDDYGVSGAPYHLPLRSERQQPVPLLHSAYHGYDNLYH